MPKISKTKTGWKIFYRFHDPTFPKPKYVTIKSGLNRIRDLKERKAVSDVLVKDELDKLQNKGFNPITNTFIVEEIHYEIDPETPFPIALEKARERLDLEHHTKRDMRSVVKAIAKAGTQRRIASLPISKVSRKHLKMCLDQGQKNGKWGQSRYNVCRGYLMMLFKELVELEAVTANPMWDISKKSVTQKLKVVATDHQRERIKQHLQKVDNRFYHFVHLFFHSGGRKTELIQLKPGMIDLDRQVYKCTIKKGKSRREVERTIKDVALPYWRYFLEGCADDQFVFGTNLLPGAKAMGVDMPTRYWQRYVKDPKTGLGINVDFYSLKHLHTSEIVDLLDEEAAADMNKHTDTAMVVNIYDVKQKSRQHERLKRAGNEF